MAINTNWSRYYQCQKLWSKNGAELMTQTIIDHLVVGAAELDRAAKQMQDFIN